MMIFLVKGFIGLFVPATHPVILTLDTQTHLRRLGLDNELVITVWAVLVLLLKVPKVDYYFLCELVSVTHMAIVLHIYQPRNITTQQHILHVLAEDLFALFAAKDHLGGLAERVVGCFGMAI